MNVDEFLTDVRKDLAAEDVMNDADSLARYGQNLSGYERRIPLVVRPRSTEQVAKVVTAANRHLVPLYAFSQGKNWGLGSKLPVVDDCALVDLSAMNRILDVNTTYGYAIVEPGVTQGQLAAHLSENKIPFFMDVTGSGASTSIIGNMMERGVAYNSLRAEKLLSLQAVLGNGEIIRTGFGHFPQSKVTALCRYGTGPDLLGLFPQSNYGIVTEATVELMPVPEHQMVFLVNIKDESQLGPMVDAMRQLTQRGALESVVHIGNRRRSEVTMTPLMYHYLQSQGRQVTRDEAERMVSAQLKGPWSAIGAIMGTKSHVSASKREIKAALGRFGRLDFMTEGLLQFAKTATKLAGVKSINDFLCASEPLLALPRGVPTDAALHSAYWPAADSSPDLSQPDVSAGGMLFAAPIVPQDSESVRLAVEATDRVGDEHGFKPAVTLNMMHDKSLEGVVSIDFVRADAEQCRRAKECMRGLNQAYMDLGFMPYRIDIENMPMIMDADDPFWKTAKALKTVLDPNNIISPRRFNLV